MPLIICMILFGVISCRQETQTGAHDMAAAADSYPGDELSIQHGMELFNLHCAQCHNFTANEIGPNLSGVTSEVSKEWLVTYIHNPQAVIEAGNERAVALFERYKMYMPSFPQIEGEDMEHLLGFIHKFSEAEKRNTSNRKGGLLNPIPERIGESPLVVELEEWMTVPASSTDPPLARINKLDAIPVGSGQRMFVSDQRGTLYEIVGDTVNAYLDVRAQMSAFIDHPGFGTGLGSFAFHPDFQKNGLLYTTHTEATGSAVADFALPDSVPAALQWVLTEWTTKQPMAGTFEGKPREVLRAEMVTQVHGFQEITFNPLASPGQKDYGMLYLGIGDGGAALGGHPEICDNPGHVWASVLRIDPSGSNSENGNYGIPEDNPYVGSPEGRDEVWCSGLRNPHRITWDTGGTELMFISNIGQHSVEEVNLGFKGADYGWPQREGSFLFDVYANSELVYPVDTPNNRFTEPALQYDHDEGNAVSGGFTYNGKAAPLLKGNYLFGDIPRGTLFIAPLDSLGKGHGGTVLRAGLIIDGEDTTLMDRSLDARVDLRFGADTNGELYLFTKNDGKIYKVVGAREISRTGLVASGSN